MGVLWSGGNWFVSEAAQGQLGGGSGGGSGVVLRSRLMKGIRLADKGILYATSPKKTVYLTFVTARGEQVYSSEGGAVLELRDP